MSSDYELSDNEYYDEDDDEEMYEDEDGKFFPRLGWPKCGSRAYEDD